MKVKKLIPCLMVIILSNLVFPASIIHAESLDSLESEEQQTAEVGQVLNKKIDTALTDVNQKYAEIEKLKADIASAEEKIQSSEAEIIVTEENIDRRKEAVGDRMKSIQLNGENRTWQILLEAESLSDFFNKAYILTVLQTNEKEKIDNLADEMDKLNELQETIKATQEELQTNQERLQQEAHTMAVEVAALKQELATNEETLQLIATKKVAEQNRLEEVRLAEEAKAKAEEAAKAEAERNAKEAESQAKQKAEEISSNTSTEGQLADVPTTSESSGTSGGQVVESTPESTGGQVLYMESTAYSFAEPGSGYITATGIDLRVQSNVIAVDPSVIPLGKLVMVAGYGYAIAGDTGGAIKGNIIDVHFNTVEQCRQWGRRHNVRVEIQ